MLSVDPKRPVPASTLGIVREIQDAAIQMGLPYLLVGATARDLVLRHVYGIELIRGTKDLDFAVAVASWDEYDGLKNALLKTGSFKAGPTGVPHRIQYVGTGGNDPVDLLPFRGVETAGMKIAWPPDMKIMMNAIGYEDALASSEDIQLVDNVRVRVASLPALALLKLFAWADRGSETSKDALDLATLFKTYVHAGNGDRIYGEAIELLAKVDYVVDLVAPRLLGHDVRRIAQGDSLGRAIALLNDPTKRDLLEVHMAKEFDYHDDPLSVAQVRLAQFTLGLEGT